MKAPRAEDRLFLSPLGMKNREIMLTYIKAIN